MSTTGTILRESNGSLTMHIVPFTTLASSDTYASGIPGVVAYWLTITSGLANNVTASAWQVKESSGTFTFSSQAPGSVGVVQGTLTVLSRS